MDIPDHARAILVVEDELFIRMVAVDILEACGLPVYEAGSACEALAVLEEHQGIVLMVTDINMPGDMDGLALAEYVHLIKPNVGLIVTSGGRHLSDADVPDDGTFLPKPYAAAGLMKQAVYQLAL